MSGAKVIPVRVALRCRPLVPREEAEGSQPCLQFIQGEPQVILGKDKAFTYDHVFGPNSTQKDVYDNAVAHLVRGIFKGYNATVLAYGQTGSGKTYSMSGANTTSVDPDDESNGVIPRVIQDLFKGIEERSDKYDFTVRVSYIELYKEDLNDLLVPANRREKDAVVIREEGSGIKLVGLTEQPVHNMEETLACLDIGAKSRTTGATAMNMHSSRSHAIFTLMVEKKSKTDETDACCAKFHLVDLAGSERAKKTQAEGERFKEGVNINKGLLALGNVISALGDDRTHIPYRDSKLTRLLQDSLGGNSHTVMVACVSPADSNMEETLSTLRYADRARKIKNKPVINTDPQAGEIQRLKQLVQSLQLQMLQSGKTPNMINFSSTLSDTSLDIKQLKERCDELENENKKISKELNVQICQNTFLTEQIVHQEMKIEKLTNVLTIVKEKTGMSISRLETTQSLGAGGQREDEDIMKAIHDEITAVESEPPLAMSPRNGEIVLSRSHSPGSSCDTSLNDEEQLSKQAEFLHRLTELNDQLLQKETIVKQMLENDEAIAEMKSKYENDRMLLTKQIEQLNSERENLLHELENAKRGANAAKLAEQRRRRLKELEEQLSQAQKTLKEQSKVVKFKEQSDQQLKKMQDEIREMKQKRIKLIKQMKEEADNFRKYKLAKEKEVMQLKAKERKREIELVKMKRTNEQQQTLLRRKAEEAAAANKRLKEALSRQKTVLEDRNRKLEASDMSGIGARVRKWLSHELEVLVSIADARHHLEGLKQDRADLVKQKKALLEKLENEPSPAKRKMSDGGIAEDSVDTEQLKQEINMLQMEIDLRSAQIADLQEKVLDAAQDEKNKSRWNNVHTMMEAKCAMKYLLNEAVNAHLEASKERTKLNENLIQYESGLKTVKELEKTIEELKNKQQEEILQMQRTYENKMLFLMNQLKNSSNLDSTQDEELRKRLHFQEKQIEKLVHFEEDLEKKTAECEKLKKELTRLNYKMKVGLDGSFLPEVNQKATPIKATHRLKSDGGSIFFSPIFLPNKESAKDKSGNIDDDAYNHDEKVDDDDGDDDDDDDKDQDDDSKDPDWKKTPLVRSKLKRKTITFRQTSNGNSRCIDLGEQHLLEQSCQCKGRCKRNCSCSAQKKACEDSCKCNRSKCSNRKYSSSPEVEESSVMNSTFSVNGTATTLSLSDQDAVTEELLDDVPETVSRPKKKSMDEENLPDGTVGKEKENDDPTCFGGAMKKKRKLHNSMKGYFPDVKV